MLKEKTMLNKIKEEKIKAEKALYKAISTFIDEILHEELKKLNLSEGGVYIEIVPEVELMTADEEEVTKNDKNYEEAEAVLYEINNILDKKLSNEGLEIDEIYSFITAETDIKFELEIEGWSFDIKIKNRYRS